jgi:hypothetical protein
MLRSGVSQLTIMKIQSRTRDTDIPTALNMSPTFIMSDYKSAIPHIFTNRPSLSSHIWSSIVQIVPRTLLFELKTILALGVTMEVALISNLPMKGRESFLIG